MHRVKHVSPMENFKLLLTFEDNKKKIFDMTPFLGKGMFAQLKENNLFYSAHIAINTVEWANGVDMCPDLLYDDGTDAL